ncbi:signal peptide protein [Ralstonia sp. A12]|uniref:SUMF1/EgtB/PvdO family nonheme iron enzyme n=1 Tax=Ralstonia sp. A12 TaxID=1217052 RepID=UPI000575DB09|nr:formylglycine-generating enzyme family protein [Ralstonia sp. A12]KHK57705.1 signal peptide protein [Ralstonia sp. A12]
MTCLPRRLAAALLVLASAVAQGADYVRLPGGDFDSVLPQNAPGLPQRVRIEPFALRTTPVTIGEYLAFVQTHAAWRRDRVPEVFASASYLADWADALHPNPQAPLQAPVTGVGWFAARAYCETEGSRLPTWLEWESAAAADATRADARDDPQWAQRILGWYERPAQRVLPPVGGPPDVHGVRDLHGLIWEWVDDFNALFIAGDSRTQGDPDKQQFCGAGAISIVRRDSYAVLMRVALLSSLNGADTTASLGFRCARTLHGETP